MKFGNLYAIPSRNGLTKPRSVRGDGIKFVNMGELFENERIGNIEMDRVPVSKTEMRDALLQEDDLLFARQSLVREGAGKCSIIAEVEEPTTFDSHLIRVRLNRSIANPSFYRYYFASPLSPMPGIVSQCAQAGIKGSDLKNLDVDCPPLEVQDKIASILGAYDELIENNRRQIKLLEEAAQRLYKEWFIDLKFPGHETTPIVDGFPEGWCKATLGELSVLITRGITPRYSETSDFLVLGQRCVRGNLVDLSCARRCEHKSIAEQKMLKCGDVLINSTGTGSLGRTAQVWFDPIEMTVDSHVTIVRASSPELSSYLAQWAFANESFIESLHTGSTGQTELPRERVSSIRVLAPSPGALNQFNSFVSPMVGKVNMLQRSIAAAREARDRLLPKLMSGEIEV